MEHQTMTSLGYFDYYVDAHELGHQWWGDNVTCKSWGDIWINEGFASYTEHLVAQYLDNVNFAPNLNSAHNNVMSQPGGSIFFTDTLNSNRIFDSRLTYDKGGAIIHTLRFVTNNDTLWFKTLRSFQNAYKNSTASVVDFKNHYQAQTGINVTQFFNQWYYGEGYPTFDVKYNFVGNTCYIKSTQSTSTPSSVALFDTPMEYKIYRNGAADTIVRVTHSNATEIYAFNLLGTVTAITCDPNNWIINKVIGPNLDVTIGIEEQLNTISEIKIGPNPTKGLSYISSSLNESLKLVVADISGKFIIQKAFEGETTIDLSNYAHGLYTVKVLNNAGVELQSKKLIKQ
jgi:hypothetical protein